MKGLTGKKRHVFSLAHKLFDQMIEDLKQISTPEDFERFKESLAELIRSSYNRLINRVFDVEELAFSVMLSKAPERYDKTTPPHVKAAQKLETIGVKVGPGDIIQYVKTKDRLGVTPLHPKIEINKNQIDVESYMEYLKGVFQQVLDSLDIDFDELISGVMKADSIGRIAAAQALSEPVTEIYGGLTIPSDILSISRRRIEPEQLVF